MTEKFTAKASILINAPTAKVWQALTDPAMVKQYLYGTEMSTDWKVGSPIRYRGVWEGKPYEDKGQVLQVIPERLLVSSYWSPFSGQPDQPEYYKTVSYALSNEGSGTRLTVTQDNNDSLEEANHSEQNWLTVLQGLKQLLEGQG